MNTYFYAEVQSWVRPHVKTNGLPFIVQKVIYLLGLVQYSNFGPGPTVTQIHLFNSLPILYEQVGAIRGTPNTITFSKILAMSTNEQTQPSQPTSAVRNTLEKEQALENLVRPISDEALREYCDKNCHQILPIIAEKLHQEKAQQEKLKAVKARLNFEETSQYSESKTPRRRRNLKERLGPRRRMRPHIQEARSGSHTTLVAETLKAATKVLALKKQKLLPRNVARKESIHKERKQCQKVKEVQEGTGSQNQRSKSRVLRMTYPNHGKLPSTEKCIKDPVEIHNIKQRDEESTKDFARRYKLECRDVKGASKCMKISGFMHGITNPELIKRLHDKIPKSMDEMMSVTIVFLRGEGKFSERTKDGTKTRQIHPTYKNTKEILALDKGMFKPPSPMTTPVEKRNAVKFYEFFGEVGHTTDECMHLKRQIEKMLNAEKLSHLIKELKQNYRKDQAKTAKKGETSGKDKPLAILMIQPWQRIARQRITQTFSLESVISFPNLGEEDGTKGPMIIEVEIGGHCVHRMYVDEDMTGVPRHVAEHRLNVREGCLPVRQKKRRQANERNGAIGEEVKKLRPYHLTSSKRESTMEEILHKFIDKGKREHEEMRAFINEFNKTKKILFKERNDSLIKLRFERRLAINQLNQMKSLWRINLRKPTNQLFNDQLRNKRHRFLFPEGVEKSDLESCGSLESETNDDSDLGKPLRRIDYVNTPYSVAQETAKPDEGEIYTDHSALKYLFSKQDANPRLIRWVLLLHGFDIEIKDKNGVENLAADHLSRLENPDLGAFTKEEIMDEFSDEHLMILKSELINDELWYADYVNYIVGKIVPPN
nr:reverse transcriptase domain-containing protein [Tanacetum cinerariifolium]